jgi:hypothetical protein
MKENRVTRADDIIWRKVENEIAILRSDGRAVHILNETAAHIWEMCNGDYKPDEIVASLCLHFDVSLAEARADVYDTLGRLEELNVLKWDRKEVE